MVIPIFILLYLGTAAWFDYKKRIIPNWLILCSFAVAATLFVVFRRQYFVSTIICVIAFFLLGLFGIIGAGDSKLLAVLSLVLPYQRLLLTFGVAVILMLAYAFVKNHRSITEDIKFMLRTMRMSGNKTKLPFVPFLLGGYIIQFVIFEVFA